MIQMLLFVFNLQAQPFLNQSWFVFLLVIPQRNTLNISPWLHRKIQVIQQRVISIGKHFLVNLSTQPQVKFVAKQTTLLSLHLLLALHKNLEQ